jgi:DNA polymerase III subunit delta'
VSLVRFSQLLGHDAQIASLKSAIEQDRLAHAYLFAGPDGIGKTTTARAFVAQLLCENPGEEACGECKGCKKIASGNHPDLTVIEPDGQFIKIEQVREVGRLSHYGTFEAKWRVFLFLEAERLNPAAANALLKTLEEPRPSIILILVTDNPQQLLPTILSRCQRVTFNPLSFEHAEKVIQEQVESDPGAARLLARLSGGSIGRVMGGDIEAMVDGRRELLLALAAVDGRSEMEVAAYGERLLDSGDDLDFSLELIKTFLRDCAVYSDTQSPDRLINPDLVDAITGHAEKFDKQRLLSMARSVGYAQRLLKRNVSKNLVTTALALELVHPTGAGFITERMPR